ncbi:MAG: ABC transporter permease [Epsilonproteobacteria bacterium]|nr:ABC transporter permease [Campylobacterota bacterium]OYZ67193.1 MAG: hypothetical protein B7Y17_00200 [Sulfuricurvum sp. 24-42-5]
MIPVSFSSHFYLLKELSKREVFLRYRGSLLGIWWALLTPMAMLLVFTFVFGEIFQAKWDGGGNIAEFSVKLYAGLVVFWFFNEIITKAPGLIVSQPNYVTKVIFPLEILPVATVIGSLFHLLINLIILLAASAILYEKVYLSIIALPIIIAVTIPMLLGIAWTFCALGVYIRDISTLIGILMNMLMFLSPIFYPMKAVPEGVRWIFELNPMNLPIQWVRESVCEGIWPSLSALALYCVLSLLIGIAGWKLFGIMRKGFSDVL